MFEEGDNGSGSSDGERQQSCSGDDSWGGGLRKSAARKKGSYTFSIREAATRRSRLLWCMRTWARRKTVFETDMQNCCTDDWTPTVWDRRAIMDSTVGSIAAAGRMLCERKRRARELTVWMAHLRVREQLWRTKLQVGCVAGSGASVTNGTASGMRCKILCS